MTKETQTQVRLLAERVSTHASERSAIPVEYFQSIAQLETARQVFLLTEELHKMGRKQDELLSTLKGIALRLEGNRNED